MICILLELSMIICILVFITQKILNINIYFSIFIFSFITQLLFFNDGDKLSTQDFEMIHPASL